MSSDSTQLSRSKAASPKNPVQQSSPRCPSASAAISPVYGLRQSRYYAELGPDLAAVGDNTLAERLADGIVGGKRPVDVVIIRQGFCERLRLGSRFGYTEADMRT